MSLIPAPQHLKHLQDRQSSVPRADKDGCSDGGGTDPLWSHTGRELFFGGPDGERQFVLKTVGITPGDTLTVGAETVLFPLDVPDAGRFDLGGNNGPLYDVSPDDQRFLMIREAPGKPLTNIVIVQNWFEELKRLVPRE